MNNSILCLQVILLVDGEKRVKGKQSEFNTSDVKRCPHNNLVGLMSNEGWMAGWMDGWMDGWMGWWMDGWNEGWTDEWVDGRTDGWTEGDRKDANINAWMGMEMKIWNTSLNGCPPIIAIHLSEPSSSSQMLLVFLPIGWIIIIIMLIIIIFVVVVIVIIALASSP